MQEYLLGIDAGTSGVKAIVMDTAGVICGSGYQECDVITPRPSWAEQRPADWWAFKGELILFGSERFPNWESVVRYLL